MENIKIMLGINKQLTASIFEQKEIKKKIKTLFDQENETIKKRYNEIKTFFEQKEIRSINFSTIYDLFKICFLEKVANESICTLFEDDSKDSLSKTILYSLTWESLMESIYGEEMLSAFKKAITTLPGPATFHRGHAIFLMKKKFSNFNPYSRKLKKINYCSECNCYCRCDSKCGGDTNKCTSPRAKKCNHHCDCWIEPFCEKMRKSEESKIVYTNKNN